MLVLIPVLTLLLFGVALQVLGRTRFNHAQTWVFALVGVFIAWFSFIVLKTLSIAPWQLPYLKFGAVDFPTVLAIGEQNWAFGFLLLTLLLSLLLADAGRLDAKNNLIAWMGALVIGAFALFAVLSRSLVSFLLNSAMLDLMVFASLLVIRSSQEQIRGAINAFLQKSLGLLLILFGLSLGAEPRPFLLVAGLLLRLGSVIPGEDSQLHSSIRPNLLLLIDLAIPISTMAFMAGTTPLESAFAGKSILLLLVCLFSIARMVRLSSRERDAQYSRILVELVAGLAIIPFLLGQVDFLLPLALVMVAVGGLQSLAQGPSLRQRIVVLVLAAGMIGLPFTPSAGVWLVGLGPEAGLSVLVYRLLLLLALGLALIAFFKDRRPAERKDQWIRVFTGASPAFLLVMPWFLLIWRKPQSSDLAAWVWPAGLVVIFAATLFLPSLIRNSQKFPTWLRGGASLAASSRILKDFFGFKWLYQLIRSLYRMALGLVNMFARIIEGEGGLLWAFVFLILISTILVYSRQ